MLEQHSDIVRILSHSRRVTTLFKRLFDQAYAANNSVDDSLQMLEQIVENVINAKQNVESTIEEQRKQKDIQKQKLENAREIARQAAADLGITYEEYLNSLTETATTYSKPVRQRRRRATGSAKNNEPTPQLYPFSFQDESGVMHYYKGRGRQPDWLLRQYALGKSINDFKNPLYDPEHKVTE